MTNDKTQVETEELHTWSGNTRTRGDKVSSVADTLGGVNVGLDAFGLIHRVFCGDFVDKMRIALDHIRETAGSLETDSDDANAVAKSFDEVDEAQADRFRRSDGRG
jgi:hypothetical protein